MDKKSIAPEPIPGLLCGPAEYDEERGCWRNIWHHASSKGTYRAVQDPPGTITLTPYTFQGETKVVHSMEELRRVDVE
jgi:hypothetical protein